MSLITILLILGISSLLLWAINKYIPMDETIRKIFNVMVAIAVIIEILK